MILGVSISLLCILLPTITLSSPPYIFAPLDFPRLVETQGFPALTGKIVTPDESRPSYLFPLSFFSFPAASLTKSDRQPTCEIPRHSPSSYSSILHRALYSVPPSWEPRSTTSGDTRPDYNGRIWMIWRRISHESFGDPLF